MTELEAFRIINGNVNCRDHQWVEAWQVLIDTGVASKLNGVIETTAAALVSLGYCRHNGHTYMERNNA